MGIGGNKLCLIFDMYYGLETGVPLVLVMVQCKQTREFRQIQIHLWNLWFKLNSDGYQKKINQNLTSLMNNSIF